VGINHGYVVWSFRDIYAISFIYSGLLALISYIYKL
jgi:hypothetical protein